MRKRIGTTEFKLIELLNRATLIIFGKGVTTELMYETRLANGAGTFNVRFGPTHLVQFEFVIEPNSRAAVSTFDQVLEDPTLRVRHHETNTRATLQMSAGVMFEQAPSNTLRIAIFGE